MRWFCDCNGKVQTIESLEPGTYRIQERQLQDYEGNVWGKRAQTGAKKSWISMRSTRIPSTSG